MQSNEQLEQSILALVSRPGYRPMKPRMIAQQLKLPKDQAAEVKRAVKIMVRRGQLAYESNHHGPRGRCGQARGQPPGGRVSPHAKGFRLRPPERRGRAGDGGARHLHPGQARGRRGQRRRGAGATHRPTPAGDPGPRGEIVEVVERQRNDFVGTYFESRGGGYVQVDGTLFAQPISVGDPGAKSARPDDKVVLEMVRFPSPAHDGEGVIAEVLGPRQTGRRYAVDHPRVRSARRLSGRRARRRPAAGRAVRRDDRPRAAKT